MAENEANLKPQKATKVKGRDIPFSEAEAVTYRADGTPESKIPGVDPETLLFQGIHPDSGERHTVTLEGLQAEFGKELGEKKYLAIAGIAQGSVFFNPRHEATSYRPPLGIHALNRTLDDLVEQYGPEDGKTRYDAYQKHAAKVASILSAKE